MLQFIDQGGKCRSEMDYAYGELLVYRIKKQKVISKVTMKEWIIQLIDQLDRYHRCNRNQNYRYLNPYSVLITDMDKIALLDLNSQGNEFVFLHMQKRTMRNHFVRPIMGRADRAKTSVDLYCLGKTIQFMLANIDPEDPLSFWEEKKYEKIIEKCTTENLHKKYYNIAQIKKDLPGKGRTKKKRIHFPLKREDARSSSE